MCTSPHPRRSPLPLLYSLSLRPVLPLSESPHSASSLSLSQSFSPSRFLSCGSVWDSAVPLLKHSLSVQITVVCCLTLYRELHGKPNLETFFIFLIFFFFAWFHIQQFQSWFKLAWGYKCEDFFYYYFSSYAQSYHIWKIIINREEMSCM